MLSWSLTVEGEKKRRSFKFHLLHKISQDASVDKSQVGLSSLVRLLVPQQQILTLDYNCQKNQAAETEQREKTALR